MPVNAQGQTVDSQGNVIIWSNGQPVGTVPTGSTVAAGNGPFSTGVAGPNGTFGQGSTVNITSPATAGGLDFESLLAKMQADSAAALAKLQTENQARLAELQSAQDARLAELQLKADTDKKRRETEIAFRQRRGAGSPGSGISSTGPATSPLGDLGASLLGSGAGKTLLGQ